MKLYKHDLWGGLKHRGRHVPRMWRALGVQSAVLGEKGKKKKKNRTRNVPEE